MHFFVSAVKDRIKTFCVFVVLFLTITSLFYGCVSLVKGEFYLSGEQYQKGAEVFKEEVAKKPEKAENWYYLGRFLLAQNKYKAANSYLKKSVELDAYKSKYYFWLGVSYGGFGKSASEIKNYQKAIELKPEYTQAHTYLGHSYFRKKQYSNALKSYEKALALSENNPSAIYNRALILYRTKKYDDSKKSFKQYVQKYAYSPKATRAVTYLNRMGDFDYRIHQFNKKRVVLEKIRFLTENGELTRKSKDSLRIPAYILEKNKALELHILVYEKNNTALAKQKAFKMKRYLEGFFPQLKPGQVKVSFFGAPEKIYSGKKAYTINSSINLFAVPGKLIR